MKKRRNRRAYLLCFLLFSCVVVAVNIFLVDRIHKAEKARTNDQIYEERIAPPIQEVEDKPVELKRELSREIDGKICFGCTLAQVESAGKRCGSFLATILSSGQGMTVEKAGVILAQKHSECHRCDPSVCSLHEKRYHRYDQLGPKELNATILEVVSVPDQHRLPKVAEANLTGFFARKENQYPSRSYLFDYNPSIVKLPQRIDEEAVYLASFRVSSQHYCFHPEERKQMMGGHKQGPPPVNLLGLALLRSNLSIVTDTVVRLTKLGRAEDFRLFSIEGHIYLAGNDLIVPLSINAERPGYHKLTPEFYTVGESFALFARDFASCASCGHKGSCGKNINYFTSEGKVYGEIWPSSPRIARAVDLNAPCDRMALPDSTISAVTPLQSFGTREEVNFAELQSTVKLLTRGRGGACCTTLINPITKDPMLVGIAHVKTPSQHRQHASGFNITPNHYLSYFYAFHPRKDFSLVAQSGYFCLSFPSQVESDAYALPALTKWRILRLGEEFECPRIHFVSGMVEDASDPQNVILTYGVNDCFSRFVKIRKDDILGMLFGNHISQQDHHE